MVELSRKEQLNDTEIQQLIDFAVEEGGIGYAYAKMASLRDEAAGIIAQFPPSEITRGFMAIFDYIIDREN
jgi:octaprenyl-diphosphate synthase